MTKNRTRLIKADKEFLDFGIREFPGLSWAERTRLMANPDKYFDLGKKAKMFRNSLFGKDKGSILDLSYFFVGLMILAIVVLLAFVVGSRINDSVQSNSDFTVLGKNLMQNQINSFSTTFDKSFLILSIFIAISVIASAVLVRVHPIFIPIFIFLLMIFIVVAAISSNIYSELEINDQVASVAAQMTFARKIMLYLPYIVGIVGTILMIVMYKSWSNAQ